MCRLMYAFQSSEELYMITEYYEGGDLRSHLEENRFSEEEVRYIVGVLSVTLEYLHNHHIVYRDMKPENVMTDGTHAMRGCEPCQGRKAAALSKFAHVPQSV